MRDKFVGFVCVIFSIAVAVFAIACALDPFFEGKSFVDGCLTFIVFLAVCALVIFLRAKMDDK